MGSEQDGFLPSDATTNAFTPSELAQNMLRAQCVRTPDCSQAHSGDTNSFTTDEHDQRLGVGVEDPDDVTPKTGEGDRLVQRVNVRIQLYPSSSKPLCLRITPRGGADPVFRQSVILDANARPGGPAVSTVAIEQSGHDIGFRILADPVSEQSINPRTLALGEALNLDLYCDPSGDRMVVINRQTDFIMLKGLEASKDEDSVGSPPAIVLNPSDPTFLGPGTWGVFANTEKLHLLDLCILPRQYVTITAVEAEARSRQSFKRAFEASQPMKAAKKGKPGESSPKPGATGAPIAFEATPTSNHVGSVAVHNAVEKMRDIAPSMHHPLEQLKPGASAKIASDRGDYTLTYCESIVLVKNSLVFKAQHSHVAGFAAVKVLRTPSYPVNSGTPDQSASKIARTSELWLKEFKNHSKLSQHAAIVRLYDADARLLSFYMEHVEAPDLSSYHSLDGKCNLGVDEAAQILADMSAAISYVHSQGIVHNDIKPANILFERTRGAVLIDFGLSSEVKDTTIHAGGSPWYIPPEYAINGKRGAPGDVFALGVVMLFVLRKIPLPDMRPGLNWLIADVRKGGSQNAARNTMLKWLGIVEQASCSSDGLQHPWLGALVREMLVPVSKRINVGDLLRHQGLT